MFLLSTDKNFFAEDAKVSLDFCCWISKIAIKWRTVPVLNDLSRPREDITHLSVQCDGTGLTLGADSLRPWRVTLAAHLDLTANVLQRCKLSSEEEQNKN